jgi:hypothetical protein
MATELQEPAITDEAAVKSFQAIIEHWGRGRIDMPLQVMARFDDAAKQLIAVGGAFQTLFLAVYAFGPVKGNVPLPAVLLLFVPLVAMIYCAARVVCTVPQKLEAKRAFVLFLCGVSDGLTRERLADSFEEWCCDVEGVAERKHIWFKRANWLFLFSALSILGLLAYGMGWR